MSKEKKAKGVNFYHNAAKVKRLNILKGGKEKRDRSGKIIKPAAFASSIPKSAISRVDPNIRWFGNTRVIGQKELEEFRSVIASKSSAPNQVLLHRHRLPMSLLTDTKAISRASLLETESFSYAFGTGAQRKRPKLSSATLQELSANSLEKGVSYDVRNDTDLQPEQPIYESPQVKDRIFQKGQSRRIWGELYKVIDSSDVLVHVLDARDPMGTRCPAVLDFVAKNAPHKHVLFLLNKCDLIPISVTSRWLEILGAELPTVAFHASLKNPYGKGDLMGLLRQFAKLHPDKKQISVGFVGYPNTGKSSVINALRSKTVCSVAPIPGQTKVWQYVTLTKRVFLIDCPGVVPASNEDSETEIVLKGVVRVENVKNPQEHIQAVLLRAKKEHLEKTYSIDSWEDAEDFLAKLAIKSGKLLRGGEPDCQTVAKMILNDWLRGKIPFFVAPPRSQPSEK